MMRELGIPASALEIARHYKRVIDGLVIDEKDAHLASDIEELGMAVEVAQTIMTDLQDRIDLARRTIGFAAGLSGGIVR